MTIDTGSTQDGGSNIDNELFLLNEFGTPQLLCVYGGNQKQQHGLDRLKDQINAGLAPAGSQLL